MNWPIRDYQALPSRQDLEGLPVHGVVYRDEAYPALVFRCIGKHYENWSEYGWWAFKWGTA